MTDGGYYAIKGFEFQIDKAILELFEADANTPIFLEQIQDINTNSFVMQVKYKETQDYTPAKIKEPIIQLLNEYTTASTKKYYLYCYFNDVQEEKRTLTITKLDRVLGNKKDNFSKAQKDGFLANFELNFSMSFQDQFMKAVDKIKTYGNCSDFDEALIYYGNITNHLRKIVVNNTISKNRTCTKNEILQLISGNRKTVFDAAYRIYKGEQQYITTIKRRHFTYRNIDNWERFIIVELNGNESVSSIKSTVLKIKNKFYRRQARAIKSGAPYIHFRNISNEKLKQLKTELFREGNVLKDGHDFKDADFQTKSICIKSTLENDVSIKFMNNDEILLKVMACNLACAKKVYQFYLSTPLEIELDIDTVNMEIKNLSEIQQILN